jgi:hypothetical protein
MAKAKKRKPAVRKARKEDSHPDVELTERDFVMARLAAARAASQSAITAIDEMLNLFVNPDQDRSAKEREECLDEALEAMGCATRALESAEMVYGELDDEDLEAGEPWEESDDEEDDDEEDEDDE